ncbi:MAG: hypothetical protein ABIG31_02250 [Candidatus Omnitrophota bacterium]
MRFHAGVNVFFYAMCTKIKKLDKAAQDTQPAMEQVFIGRGVPNTFAF